MKLVIDIPDDELRHCVSCESGEMTLTLSINETVDGYDITSIVSDTYDGNTPLKYKKVEPLTPDILADLLMEERIRGELKQDTSYSKDIIDDVKCKLTVDIIDRRPCYCCAQLSEVWRESEEK